MFFFRLHFSSLYNFSRCTVGLHYQHDARTMLVTQQIRQVLWYILLFVTIYVGNCKSLCWNYTRSPLCGGVKESPFVFSGCTECGFNYSFAFEEKKKELFSKWSKSWRLKKPQRRCNQTNLFSLDLFPHTHTHTFHFFSISAGKNALISLSVS